MKSKTKPSKRVSACLLASLQIYNRVIGDSFSLAPAEAHVTIGVIFDAIADMLITPLLGERMRQTVMRSSLKDIAASMRGGRF